MAVLSQGYIGQSRDMTLNIDSDFKDTFHQFCQVAYTGDYETPSLVYQPEARLSTQFSSPHSVTDNTYPVAAQ
jgi:hypothetical protein